MIQSSSRPRRPAAFLRAAGPAPASATETPLRIDRAYEELEDGRIGNLLVIAFRGETLTLRYDDAAALGWRVLVWRLLAATSVRVSRNGHVAYSHAEMYPA
jgi:hypothetical protein